MNFEGNTRPLSDDAFVAAAKSLGCEEAVLRAVIEVEAPKGPFDQDRRPTMLFEPHRMYRYTTDATSRNLAVRAGVAVAGSWSRASANYPKGSSYPRLKKAMEINATAALMSCSVGMGQIMAENFRELGYASVQAFWLDAIAGADRQLDQMVRFLKFKKLESAMKRKDWRTIALRWNGAKYEENNYHNKLASAYAKWKKKRPERPRVAETALSADEMKTYQTQLASLGYAEVGRPNSDLGSRTVGATAAFQFENNLPITGELDETTLAALRDAPLDRPISADRAKATEVPKSGIYRTFQTMVGVGSTGTAISVASEYVGKAQELHDTAETAFGLLAPFKWLIATYPLLFAGVLFAIVTAVGIGALIVYLRAYRKGRVI